MADPNQIGLAGVGGDSIPSNLMYPGLMQLIPQTALPAQIARQTLQYYPSGGKQSVTIPIEDGSPVAVASRVGEYDEIPMDVAPINPKTVTVYKVARGHPIPNELVLFQQVPVIQEYLMRLGLVLGNTIDVDCWSVIQAGAYAPNQVPVSGDSLMFDGTEFTRPGTVGQKDIVEAIRNVSALNYKPDTLAVNAEAYSHISYLPQYHGEFLYGKPAYMNGEMGSIEGLRILVSQNVPAGSAFVLATGINPTALGQYSPLGFYVEGLPITTMIK